MTLAIFGSVLCAAALLGALISEERYPRGVFLFKPLASIGFLLVALSHGALSTGGFGIAIFVALLFSFGGDVFLMWRSNIAFLLGLGSFLLGHLGFAVAFVIAGVSWGFTAGSLALLTVPFALVLRWLLPHVGTGPMRGPVIAYAVIITAMVALSVGAYGVGLGAIFPIAAVVFYLSDLTVARDRFVKRDRFNRWVGLPLYYAAQLGFAWGLASSLPR